MKKLLPLLLAAACILSSCSCLPPGKGWTKELSDDFCLFYQTANQQGSFQSNYILTVTLPAGELPSDVRNRLIQLPLTIFSCLPGSPGEKTTSRNPEFPCTC